jgi:hypothetical protein
MIYLGATPGVVYTGGYGYGTMINGTLSVTTAGNNRMTIALKTRAGTDPTVADPVMIIFPTTAVSGGFTTITVTAAVSLVINSGSTMGVISATAFRIWIVGFNDGGTFRLGAINCTSVTTANASIDAQIINIFSLYDGIYSSTTPSGNSAGVIYTGVAVTNQPMRVLGYAEWSSGGLAIAGTWTSTNFTYVQLFGPGVPLPGTTVKTRRMWGSENYSSFTMSTVIPNDDSIPQISEGTEVMSLSYVPTSGANLLRIQSQAHVSVSGGDAPAMALFRDSTANALAAIQADNYTGTAAVILNLNHTTKAVSAASTVFRVRAAATSGATLTFQGRGGARYYGGAMDSYMEIMEIMG